MRDRWVISDTARRRGERENGKEDRAEDIADFGKLPKTPRNSGGAIPELILQREYLKG
jgi:hypothetical protein